MPDVFLDRRLPDYFDQFDVSTDEGAAGVLPSFLNSRMAVLSNARMRDLDLPLLRSITFPQTWEMKKFQFASFLDDYQANGSRAEQYDVVLNACERDKGRLKALVGQFKIIRQSLDELLARVLNGAKRERSEIVSRFCETRQENLHFDLDAGADDHEAFRLYINIDSAPRIWTTSYQLNDLAHRLAGRIGMDELAGDSAEAVLKKISRRAFGGWHNRADERDAPRHMVYFDPGDVWVMDGRSLAHQVLYGARVINTYIRLPIASNPTLKPSFPEKMKRAADDVRGPRNNDGDGVVIHGKVHPAPDIKESWTQVFGETGTGRVRRFTGQGMV